MRRRLVFSSALPALPVLAHAAPLGYFLHAAGPAATPVMHLGWEVTGLCIAVLAIIVFLLVGAMARRRRRADPRALGREEGGTAWVYIGAGLSTLALLATLAYTLVTLQTVLHPPTRPGLTIAVTAYDWWWKVDYPDSGDSTQSFTTANEIHIPVGTPVKIELKSADVIHSFWVPRLAGKTQAIPGQTNTQWIQADAAGVYRGQCSQFCGAQHAHMAFEVVAQSQADFDAWRRLQRRQAEPPGGALVQAGHDFFMKNCAGCHTVRGTDAAGVFAPDLTHLDSRLQLAAGTLTNTPAHLLDWIQHAQQIKPESLMPSFALSTRDAAALSAYLATLH